ncbi:tetraacyldisaccharide 4'-kinase [Maricaulis sp. D1M11]|uniref:tetraacyldisaccharide 4'-kinase n=1 Tax=Maricaulis sp. D1M11 TaxID=3076117 RepID=UPI0039B4C70B
MKEPDFWSRPSHTLSDRIRDGLLSPLSTLYAWAGQRRLDKTVSMDPGIPVICIGNLTLGGTGKTPLTRHIQACLTDMGHRPACLSRGYGGREPGPLRVDTDRHSAMDVGDEPLLLARDGEAWISRDRPAGARAMAADGATVILMDDGHQNPSLAKTASLVVIDGRSGWGNGRVFPAGPLREPVSRGLARADAIVVMTPDRDALPDYTGLKLDELEIPVFHAWLAPCARPPDGPLLAFAGIGKPQKVFDSLALAGADLVGTESFADHHVYTTAEIDALFQHAAALDARLITTEKDWVRLPPAVQEQVLVWPIEVEFANTAAFDELLRRVLDDARPAD